MGQDQELPMIRWRPRAQVAASQPIYCSRPRRRQAGRYPVFRLAPGVKSGMNEAGRGSPMDLPRVRVRLIGAGTLRVGPADARPSLPGTDRLGGAQPAVCGREGVDSGSPCWVGPLRR